MSYFSEFVKNLVRDCNNKFLLVYRGVAQSGLACMTGGHEVGGSNPLAPTISLPLATSL